MGIRRFEFEQDAICESCGAIGAWDFYGDILCNACVDLDEEEEIDDEHGEK